MRSSAVMWFHGSPESERAAVRLGLSERLGARPCVCHSTVLPRHRSAAAMRGPLQERATAPERGAGWREGGAQTHLHGLEEDDSLSPVTGGFARGDKGSVDGMVSLHASLLHVLPHLQPSAPSSTIVSRAVVDDSQSQALPPCVVLRRRDVITKAQPTVHHNYVLLGPPFVPPPVGA